MEKFTIKRHEKETNRCKDELKSRYQLGYIKLSA